MKKITYILIMALAVPLFLTSCLKEDNVSDPVISEVKMFMTAKDSKDSLINEVFKGKRIKIVVYTDANIVSIWPGDIRTIMKKKNSTIDSIDMFNHPVLVASNNYSDYGLVLARGLTTSVTVGGWSCFYTYPVAGQFDLTIVGTNHGYDGPEWRRIIYNAGKITVK